MPHRIYGSLVALAFLIAGGYWLARQWWVMQHWQEVPAIFENVWLDETRHESGSSYKVKVRYHYVFQGTTYRSEVFDLRDRGPILGDSAESERIAGELREKSHPTCWIDPRNPARSVLDPSHGSDTDWALLLIGVVMALLLWGVPVLRQFFQERRPGEPSLSGSVFRKWSGEWLTYLGSLLIITGTLVSLTAAEWLGRHKARDWVEIPCEIKDSYLVHKKHEWLPMIAYSYTWENKPHEANQVSVATFSLSVIAAEKLVNTYAAGSASVCYVNPANPFQAILVRTEPPWMLTVFSAVLLFLFCSSLIESRREWRKIKEDETETMLFEQRWKDEIEDADDPESEEEGTDDDPVPMPLPPSRREVIESQLKDGMEIATNLRRRFFRVLPWWITGGGIIFLLVPDIVREWELETWGTFSQWIALGIAMLIILTLPFLAYFIVYRWRLNRQLMALLISLSEQKR